MAHGTYNSTELTNFSKECNDNYSKFKDTNSNNYVSKCKEFGSGFKKALVSELRYKLISNSENFARVPYDGFSVGYVISQLEISDSQQAIESFNKCRETYIKNITDYFQKVQDSYAKSVAAVNEANISLKGHFKTFYNSCIKHADNLVSGKDIKKNLNEIVVACRTYLDNSKKVTIKKSFFKKSIDFNGRAACIFLIKNAANHLAKLKI